MALPADFWNLESANLQAILLPAMESMAIAGSKAATGKLDTQAGIRIDDTLAHAQAAQWARQFTDELLIQIGTTNERAVGEIVANWIATPGATMADLNRQLRQVLDVDETRAARIAATETTRAFARGEDLSNREAGLPEMATQPPGHPNCRCFTSNQLLTGGIWVVVWQTRRDELVCKTTRIITPWGVEMGCFAMHRKVISQGIFLGDSLAEARRGARALVG
jgi:hypothetical protein